MTADAFETLGEDLLILSVRPASGKLITARRIDYGLMGSELVRLAAAGRIDIVSGRIVVQGRAGTGDAELDAALASLVDTRYPPDPVTWIGLPRRGIRGAYLSRLTSSGVLRATASGLLGIPRYRITGPERAAQARSRLDAVERSAGEPAELAGTVLADTVLADTVLGALASAIGLDRELYPGSAGRPLRAHLAELARGQWPPHTVTAAGTRGTATHDPAEDDRVPQDRAAQDAAAQDPAAQGAVPPNAVPRDPAAHDAVPQDAAALEAAVLAAVRAATCAVVQAVHNVGPHRDGPPQAATDEMNRSGRFTDTII
jgi:hypothetical protein